MASGVLAILGSGETAPGMTKVHRALLERHHPVRAVNLDSAYGFQENVPQMSEKLEEYFATSLRTELTTLHFNDVERADELERALFKQRVRAANYVFAGPGSPSFALRQWAPLDFTEDLRAVLDGDGTLCISSAAALTLGAFTAPIYEIYKVGVEPYWLPGLNLLAGYDLDCVVVPHFDNAEGGNYDTRRCYLGERRLRLLEGLLPPTTATLGVDEHTALIIDFANDTARVSGRSNAYWRYGGEERVLAKGSTTELAELRHRSGERRAPNPATLVGDTPAPSHESQNGDATSDATSLGRQVLNEPDRAAVALARLVELAGRTTEGFIDPSPIIEGVLSTRRRARELGQYELADSLRDSLANAGVSVNDGPDGSTWSLI